MANDKLNHEDDPLGTPSLLQWFEEIEKHEAANFRGTANKSNAVGADDITMPGLMMPFSLFPGAEGTSNAYAKDMLPTDLNLMTDLTQFNYSLSPILDYSSVYGKNHIPIQPSTDSNFLCLEGSTDFGQYDTLSYSVPPVNAVNASSEVSVLQPYVDRELVTASGSATALNCLQQDGELNSSTSRPHLIRSFIGDRGSTPMSCPTLDNVELAINNSLLLSEVQEDHPEKLDGSCLTLGIGHKSKDLSESNILGRNSAYNSERDVLPQSNIFHSQQANGSSFNTFLGTAAGFSCFQNNMPQVDKQHQFLVPRNRNVCLGVEGNWDERFAYFDPNNGFQGYPVVSVAPVGSSLARLPDPGLSKVNELSLSGSLNTNTCLPLSDQLQKHHMETYANLFSDSSMVCPPVVGARNTSLHHQSGKPFTANEGMMAPVAEKGLFAEEFSFSQLASNCYEPQVISAVLSSTNLPGSVMTGKEIPATKVNRVVPPSRAFVDTSVKRGAVETSAGTYQAQPTISGKEITATTVDKTAQCLRASVGTSVKRGAAETSPATSEAEHRKARRTQSSTGPSAKAPFLDVSSLQSLGPTSPSLLLQAKSTTLIQPLSQTRSPLPREFKGLPSLSQTSPSLPPEFRSLFQTTSSLPLQVKGIPSLPSLSHTAPSIQPQAKSFPSFLPITLSTPIKTRRNALLPPQSQTAHSLPPQAKTTTSLPMPSLAVASLPPITYARSPPTLYQNAPSRTQQPQTASPFPSQQTTGRPLPLKSLAGSPLAQKSQTASPLPSKSHTASSLSRKFITPPLLPPQPQTSSPVPLKSIAPPRPRPPQTMSPLLPKVNAPPLPSVVHIKWKGTDQTELTGHKCLICKRDLAFTPEGPVSVPPIAPVVAVLPCGHTFHDHCLQLITAEDEVKSPPCIPCAIGES